VTPTTGRYGTCRAVVVALIAGAVFGPQVKGSSQEPVERYESSPAQPTLADAQSLFYNARYEASAALALTLVSAETQDLASFELRTSALLFQLKRLLEGPPGALERDKPQKGTKRRCSSSASWT